VRAVGLRPETVFKRLTEEEWKSLGDAFHLSARQLSVLRLMCLRRERKQMAKELSIDLGSVQKHCGRVHKKLGVPSDADALLKMLPLALQRINERQGEVAGSRRRAVPGHRRPVRRG